MKPQQQFEQRTGKATASPPVAHNEPKVDSPTPVKETTPVTAPTSQPPSNVSVSAAKSTFTPTAPTSTPPPKTTTPAATTSFSASGSIKVQQNKCAVCGKTCYPQESLIEDKKNYHKVKSKIVVFC